MIVLGAALQADMPAFKLLRAEDDFSKGACDSSGTWARSKHIVLDSDSWLSFGGESRLRFEYFKNEDWSAADNDPDGYLLTRAYLHADLLHGPFRVFTQLQSSFSEGRAGGPGPIDEDRLDLQQLFASWSWSIGDGGNGEIRVGRQELQYGSGRLIAVRAGANTRKTFDGALFRMRVLRGSIDAFWFRPVGTKPGVFDDNEQRGRHLAGVYATLKSIAPGLNLDAYILSTREPNRIYPGIAGVEHRWTLGVRPSGMWRDLDYNFELVAQFGRFAGERIRAWTVASDTGWTWRAVPCSPRLGLKANVASGDSAAGDGQRGTFNALFPKASYFGEISQVGPANFMNLHPSVTLSPSRSLDVTFDFAFFWRQKLDDGVYGANLALEREPGDSRARHVGNQFDVTAAWRVSRFVTVEASAAEFTAGRFLEETGSAEAVRYFSTTLTCQF